jgi:hypothetical protein
MTTTTTFLAGGPAQRSHGGLGSAVLRCLRIAFGSLLALALIIALMAIAGLALPGHPADAVPEPGLAAWMSGTAWSTWTR